MSAIPAKNSGSTSSQKELDSSVSSGEAGEDLTTIEGSDLINLGTESTKLGILTRSGSNVSDSAGIADKMWSSLNPFGGSEKPADQPCLWVLTGGPGSGKTSLLLALESRGESIVREAAADVIRLWQASGTQAPWAASGFDKEVVTRIRSREAEALKRKVKRVFCDRGIFDTLGYRLHLKKEVHPAHQQLMDQALREKRYNKVVFLVQNLGSCVQDGIRHEDLKEAQAIEEKLREVYTKKGFEVVEITRGTIDERVAQVMKKVNLEVAKAA